MQTNGVMGDTSRPQINVHNNPPPPDLPLPDLIGSTDILTDERRKKLCRHLPARAEGYSWTLIYSSAKHGFSLKTLYREMNKFESPVLMIIEDTYGSIFGALISCSLRVSDHFYGTGETFLFTFGTDSSQLLVYPWTGENLFFVKGDQNSLSLGAGDGNFGLWLDGDLFHGRSHPCKTFGNSMLSLEEDFVVKALECWAFV
ncbi:oxidation resistance protein 1-like [Oppia nitens]|uniref:oxidation resistance protein 1-like n=1 Tax=Oppia nitens TaxID=1686743 RepID=UPI0023D9D960|nr:oxidation resistance protein 1-like [Oppia nitens]